MLKKLLPKEEKYFEYFSELSSLLEEIDSNVHQLYNNVKDVD